MLSACGEVRTAKPSRRPDASRTRRRERSGITRVALLNTKRRRSSRKPLLDALGNGEAGERGAADALNFWRRRFAGLPADEGSKEAGVTLDLLDMFLGVSGVQEFKTGDGATGIERDEEV